MGIVFVCIATAHKSTCTKIEQLNRKKGCFSRHKGWSLPYTFSHGLGCGQNEVKRQLQEALEKRVNRSRDTFQLVHQGVKQ